MDSGSIGSLIAIIILVALSAFFSSSETAYTTINRIRFKNMAASGNKRAALALSLSDRYDELLSTILIGNNIVNIASASIATMLFIRFFGGNGPTLSTVVMTIVVLIFGEISPKSIAKENAEGVALAFGPALKLLMTIFTPLNFIFRMWKKLISKAFRPKKEPGLSGDELMTLVDEAENEGGIDKHEGQLIRAAIEFNDVDAEDILTPRVDLVAVDKKKSMDEIAALFLDNGFSRFPVYENTIDNIIGVIHEKDFFAALHRGATSIDGIISEVAYITENTKISILLQQLQKTKSHLAVVVDEFGGTVGIVTMEDIFEELVGDIWDEHDEVIEQIHKTGEHTYRIKCSADLEDIFDLFGIDEEFDSVTVSGWVVQELEKIPDPGDHFTFENLDVTVLQTDGRKVLEIEVKVNPEPEQEQEKEKKKEKEKQKDKGKD